MAAEDVLSKSGEDLFREIRRQYQEAEVDDYFKAGQWKDDKMRLDLQLFIAHRSEAGAPDAPELADVKLPEMPKAQTYPGIKIALAGVNGAVAGVPPRPLLGAATQAVGTAGGGAIAELKAIALFVAKWKLNPSRAKIALAPLTQVRRRYVIDNFEGAKDKDSKETEDVTKALEDYIKQCAETKAWGDAPAAPPMAAVTGVTPRPGLPMGLKRPLMPSGMMEANKRPALGAGARPVGAVTAAAGTVRPPLGGARPTGLVRPVATGGIRLGQQGW